LIGRFDLGGFHGGFPAPAGPDLFPQEWIAINGPGGGNGFSLPVNSRE
jgi:hypothetical protein